jgi:hypothetical protein
METHFSGGLAGRAMVLDGNAPVCAKLVARTARALANSGARVVTVHAPADRPFPLTDLIRQVVRQAPPDIASLDRLECAFETLTRPEPGRSRAVLLVVNAEKLARESLEYLQLTCRSGREFRLMLLGRRELVGALAGPGLGWLREHIVVTNVSAAPVPPPKVRRPTRAKLWAMGGSSLAAALALIFWLALTRMFPSELRALLQPAVAAAPNSAKL